VTDKFIKCSWTCAACKQRGGANLWQRPGESEQDTTARYSQQTRSACFKFCTFTLTVGRERKEQSA
jgi:hypothetical protein